MRSEMTSPVRDRVRSKTLPSFVAKLSVIGASALTVLTADTSAAAGRAADLIQPHRAVYEATLMHTSNNSEVIGVEGRMAFEWRDDCEGWGVDQIYLLSFSYASGTGVDIRSSYNTWEAKDGSRYTAKVDRDRGGEKEVFSVEASDGVAQFRGDRDESFTLQPGTMFPTAHTLALLDRAEAGPRFLSVSVFDGSEVEPASLISAVVGKAQESVPPITNDAVVERYWPMQLAFFKADQQESVPDFEMRIDMQINGVARELVIDYGDFVVAMKLKDLELLSGQGC
jgi:hypothetical protein